MVAFAYNVMMNFLIQWTLLTSKFDQGNWNAGITDLICWMQLIPSNLPQETCQSLCLCLYVMLLNCLH